MVADDGLQGVEAAVVGVEGVLVAELDMPWLRNRRSLSRVFASLVVMMPPSPQTLRFLRGCREKPAAAPTEPALRLPTAAPMDWQASSTTGRPFFFAIKHRVDVQGLAAPVHGQQGLGLLGDRLFDLGGVDHELVVAVHEDDARARRLDGAGRGHEACNTSSSQSRYVKHHPVGPPNSWLCRENRTDL